jgi:phosphoserine aminotransferase
MDRFGAAGLRTYNFSAGPAPLPELVLAEVARELERGRGSILEQRFDSDAFRAIIGQAQSDLRDLLAIPEDYAVLFLQGGASAQFSLVPLNLCGAAAYADYVETGYWSRKAIAEGRRFCRVNVVASSAATQFDRIPDRAEWSPTPGAAYCHITSNETAEGVEYAHSPVLQGAPLVADMTASLLTRPVDVRRYGLIYASAQKNLGPAGLTVLVIRRDLFGRALAATPHVMNYAEQAQAGSLLNTPPTFAIYVAGLVLRWVKASGGLKAMDARAQRQSAMLYRAIDANESFYRCSVLPAHRSRVNVCFQLRQSTLTPAFLLGAEVRGLYNLKGHSHVGGIRASLYNSMADAGVRALVDFMHDFAVRYG